MGVGLPVRNKGGCDFPIVSAVSRNKLRLSE
jgi:hypothetical protein